MGKRLVALGLVCVAGVFAGVALASSGGDTARPAGLADDLSLSELVGQRFVTGYVGTTPPGAVLRAVRRGQIGGVIMFQNNIPSKRTVRRAITRLQRAARAGGQPALFVMIDQEGGIVKRIPDAPPTLNPRQMGRRGDVAGVARSQGRATGKMLRSLGINVNLAPVADVPNSASNFLGNRAYSRDPVLATDGACGFATGLQSRDVAATLKHFPGLGHAGGDTDFEDIVIRATRRQIDVDLLAYRRCPGDAELVMMSSARYPRMGNRRIASQATWAYDLLREQGFSGLTITDALETPQFLKQSRPERLVVAAGVDIVLYGQAFDRAMRSYKRLLADAKAGRFTRAELRASAERILLLKSRLARGEL
jgi:beta-N-acetylhexosaminidase